MLTVNSAETALKSVYLDVLTNQLNVKINPLLARIEQTTNNIQGKDVYKTLHAGINGGVGAGDEGGALPTASSAGMVQMRIPLKNLYGTIEVSDKVVRASAVGSTEFVNALNNEMEGLLQASKFNLGRMLFGDGKGIIATLVSGSGTSLKMDSVRNFIEGMVVDVMDEDLTEVIAGGVRVLHVNRGTKIVTFDRSITADADSVFVVQGSYNKELCGIETLFGSDTTLYGITRSTSPWLASYTKEVTSITDNAIHAAVDYLEENTGSEVDFIVCSPGVKRAYMSYMLTQGVVPETMVLDGGFKAISFNGVPIVADRFVPAGTMYLLNTKAFHLHQLSDWRWLEDENGNILKQIAGKAAYSATLVKYCELVCDQPGGQGKLTGITEA